MCCVHCSTSIAVWTGREALCPDVMTPLMVEPSVHVSNSLEINVAGGITCADVGHRHNSSVKHGSSWRCRTPQTQSVSPAAAASPN
jgi:hypothetical protein